MRKVPLSSCLAIAGLLSACGNTREAKEPTLPSLHSEAEAILAMRAPRYSGTGDKADAIQFIKSDIGAWVVRRKHATDALISKYEAARSHASGPGVALMYADVARLLYDFSREFNDAGAASVPSAIRADSRSYDAYLGALAQAMVPELSRAIREAEECVAVAQASEVSTAVECQRTKHDAALLRGKASPSVPSLDGATRL